MAPAPPEVVAALVLQAGTEEHYEDPDLYDHAYRRRRRDVAYYRALAREVLSAPRRLEGGGALSGTLLELGCGSGRVLVPLCKDGYGVVGVDRSGPMLRRCQERLSRLPLRQRGLGRLVQADFRHLPVRGRFPLVICPFNAFLHLYTRQDVEACLQGVRACLAPGGVFALDVMMPDPAWLARDPRRRWARQRLRHPRTGQPLIHTNAVAYDPATQVALTRIYYQGEGQGEGTTEVVQHLTQRMFYPQELSALLHYNGFQVTCHDGGFDGEPLTPESTDQVIRACVR